MPIENDPTKSCLTHPLSQSMNSEANTGWDLKSVDVSTQLLADASSLQDCSFAWYNNLECVTNTSMSTTTTFVTIESVCGSVTLNTLPQANFQVKDNQNNNLVF